MKCLHVSTIGEADACLRARAASIKVVTLDIFVRVGGPGNRRTGIDWLGEISSRYPPGSRNFALVVISGHTEHLGKAAAGADLVLQKPWEPARLRRFLQERNLLGGKKRSPR